MQKAQAMVQDVANQIASGAVSASSLEALAKARNLKAQDQKSFTLGSPLGQGPSASTNEALEDAIFALKDGEVTKTPVKVGDSWYIVGVTKREDAKMEDFAKQRDDLIEQMLSQKRGVVFSDYLAATRQKLEDAGQIKIYKDALAKVDGPEQPVGEEPERE
jgi:parvulin-like peptidyl-prolyl isomerase